MIDNQKKIKELRKNWVLKANELGFEIITPYVLNYNSKKVECFALLPQFGSTKGMILNVIFLPDYETNSELLEICKSLGMYYSSISYDSYVKGDKQMICEALLDWGYFGKSENKPFCIDS